MNAYKWHEANENEDGIATIALEETKFPHNIGYNGILKGDIVQFGEKEYTIVMVSRLGYFGLSETGKLPYELTVKPNAVTKVFKDDL
jgi:hypothetical protein